MKRDSLIKIIFILLMLVSIYFIISGLMTNDNNTSDEIMEQGLQLSSSQVDLYIDEEFQVIGTVIPDNATYKNIEWKSSNPTIATVDNGLIKAISAGTCIIQASTERMKITRIVTVNVKPKTIDVEKIEVTNSSIELYIGDTSKIEYKVLPEDATNKNLSITSENPEIVSFNSNNEIVGVSKGETNIILKSNNNIEAKIKVTVKERIIPTESITLSKTSIELKVGATETITATIKPDNATNKTVTWKSSNDNVVSVTGGKITAKAEGTATITASTSDEKEATCNVTVKPKEEKPIVPDKANYKYEGETLKYYVTNQGRYYLTYIWMKDPYNQVKKIEATVAKYGKVLSDEEMIGNYTLQRNSVGEMMRLYIAHGIIPSSKAAIGFNASGFYVKGAWNPPSDFYNIRSDSWLVITDNKVVRNRTTDNTNTNSYPIGIDYNGNLKIYDSVVSKEDRERVYNEVKNDKVQNTWSFYPPLIKNGQQIQSSIPNNAKRQAICQLNSNNYVMLTSIYNISINEPGDVFMKLGCKTAFNLDGGGSTSLFIKKPGNTFVTQVKCSDGSTHDKCRSIVEGIYFVEK